MKRILLSMMTALLLSVGTSWAGPFEDGVAAYQSGDYATALPIFQALAAQGDAAGQDYLGMMYNNGYGVTLDYAEALKWFGLAATQGNASAQFSLGVMYYKGQGITQDYAEALKWFGLAATQGDVRAQYNLGVMYVNGLGVLQDYTEALKWYRLAADYGNGRVFMSDDLPVVASAQYNVGVMYYKGQGVTQDYAEALEWFRVAAQLGNTSASYAIGLMYNNGYGVLQDYAEAFKWYRLATGTDEFPIQKGWNLMGNGTSSALAVAATFGDAAKVSTVWKWDSNGAKWAFYAPSLEGQSLTDYATSKGYDVLTTINGGEGFWVNATTDFMVTFPVETAMTFTSYQTMPSGWNLVAIGSDYTPNGFIQMLSLTNTPALPSENRVNLMSLWAWNASLANWYFYAPSLDHTGTLLSYISSKGFLDFTANGKTLGLGVGFWLNKP